MSEINGIRELNFDETGEVSGGVVVVLVRAYRAGNSVGTAIYNSVGNRGWFIDGADTFFDFVLRR